MTPTAYQLLCVEQMKMFLGCAYSCHSLSEKPHHLLLRSTNKIKFFYSLRVEGKLIIPSKLSLPEELHISNLFALALNAKQHTVLMLAANIHIMLSL